MSEVAQWTAVCPLDAIVPATGVCALVDGEQIAIFRLADDTVYAIGNKDPFSGANVLSRGLVGDRGGIPKVASPLYKQNFNLQDGSCFDDPAVSVPAYEVRIVDGTVEIGSKK